MRQIDKDVEAQRPAVRDPVHRSPNFAGNFHNALNQSQNPLKASIRDTIEKMQTEFSLAEKGASSSVF